MARMPVENGKPDKADFVNHIMFTDCDRCPIYYFCCTKSASFATCEDVAMKYYNKKWGKSNGKKDCNA